MRSRTRPLAVAAVVFAGLAVAATSAAAATQLYPNLETLPPRELRLDRADVSADGHGDFRNVLRFSNTVWNSGPGKLYVHGHINPATGEGTAYQRVYDDAGGTVDYPVGRFYYHAIHYHYHYDDWGRYALFTKAEYDSWVAAGRPATLPSGVDIGVKTTSCILDEEFIRPFESTPWPAVFSGSGCGTDRDNNLLEGLSVGWGDTYDYTRPEQWIDLGQQTLADGEYVLRSVTDEINQIYESPNRADATREGSVPNEGVTRFTISGGTIVDGLRPTGTVAINNVDAQTTSPRVTVKILGRDDVSGVDQVRLSNDGATWATYSYTGGFSVPQQISWDLSDTRFGGTTAAGTKTVYAQFKDRAGNWSTSETDTITLVGSTPPPPSGGYAKTVADDAPVSHWRLGESSGATAVDTRGANAGTYLNGTLLGHAGLIASEPANKAAGFDGSNDMVSVGDSNSLDLTNAITVEAWIKPTAIPAAGGFASVVSKPEAYSIQFNGQRLEFTVMQSGARRRLQAPPGTVSAGGSYHVVGTYDGTTQRLYVNGEPVASSLLTGPASTNTNSLTIGSWHSSEYFRGTIDEAAVYSTVLSPARVRAHFDAGREGGTTPPPVEVNAPSGLSAAPTSPTAIDLNWTDNSSNETNFIVQRADDLSFANSVEFTLAAGRTSFTDAGLSPERTYFYRVKAVASGGESGWSNATSTTTPAQATIASYYLTVWNDGPTSYWRLGETTGNVAGDSKTANPGNYLNGPAQGQPSLLASDTQNRAVGLDGADDTVRVPTSPSLNLTSAITLEAWIRPAAIPLLGFASVLSKAEAYSLQFNSGRMEFTVMQNGARRRLQAPSGAVVAGQQYHVVGTFDGVTQRLYLNGTQVASAPRTGAASIFGSDLYVGSWDGRGETLGGVVDEAAVYARTLTAAQVKAHYDAGVAAGG